MVSLKVKLDEALGFNAPRMFVKKEITKNDNNIKTTMM
jgi:hypothetical protein